MGRELTRRHSLLFQKRLNRWPEDDCVASECLVYATKELVDGRVRSGRPVRHDGQDRS